MDVGVWLRDLGLGRYKDKFRDSKIDVDVLADLTDGRPQKTSDFSALGDRNDYWGRSTPCCRHELPSVDALHRGLSSLRR